jgi:uncharacterized protein YceH (UPF0502 family)
MPDINNPLNIPELTAAQVIYGLQKALDRAQDKIDDLEDYKERMERSDGQLKSEFVRQIAQREKAYAQCEAYLLNTRVQLDACCDARSEAEKKCAELDAECQEWDFIVANKDVEIGALKQEIKQQLDLRFDDDGFSYESKVSALRQRVSHLAARLKQYENCDWPENSDETPLDVIARLGDRIESLEELNARQDRQSAQLSAIWDVFSTEWRESWNKRTKERP